MTSTGSNNQSTITRQSSHIEAVLPITATDSNLQTRLQNIRQSVTVHNFGAHFTPIFPFSPLPPLLQFQQLLPLSERLLIEVLGQHLGYQPIIHFTGTLQKLRNFRIKGETPSNSLQHLQTSNTRYLTSWNTTKEFKMVPTCQNHNMFKLHHFLRLSLSNSLKEG